MCPTNARVPKAEPVDRASETCVVVRDVLDRVGDKWSVLVITLLGGSGYRFSELQRAIEGISQRMLTLTLRQLERDGLVSRTAHATVPPRVDYALTSLGASALDSLAAFFRWATEHGTDIAEARRRYDEATAADVAAG